VEEDSVANKLVPAKYIGHHAINLVAGLGPFFNADGSRRQSLTVEYGDIILMPEREILGQSYFRSLDTEGHVQLVDMGAGKRVKAEHADLTDEALSQLGYEFHLGRADFQFVSDAELAALKQADVAKETTPGTPVAPSAEEQLAPVVESNVSSVVRGG
jgi:hypothetical protein